MGERKGTNLYYPPDYDPKKGGINKFLGTHPLRERARKLDEGILIIRFEMPFNIWCNGCENHIGMGVRYNAEKKKIGNYYSTPVWNFRMKCHLCDNHFEIKTEPKTCEYVVVSGARRQENRWDPKDNEQVVPEDKQTSKRLYDDAMFKLEHGSNDQQHSKTVAPTLARLTEKRDRLWQDDYAANSTLRQKFREETKELKVKEARNSSVLQNNDTDEERTAKKQKRLLGFYESKKSQHVAELVQKNPLTSAIVSSVRKKQSPRSVSLVSGAYDSSSSSASDDLT